MEGSEITVAGVTQDHNSFPSPHRNNPNSLLRCAFSIKEETFYGDDGSEVADNRAFFASRSGRAGCNSQVNCVSMQSTIDGHAGFLSSEISIQDNIKLEVESEVYSGSRDRLMSGVGDLSYSSTAVQVWVKEELGFNSLSAVTKGNRDSCLGIVKVNQGHVALQGRRPVVSRYFGRLLKCPKCAACFKFGFNGKDPGLLIDHVGKFHKKFKSECILAIMNRYKNEYNSLSSCKWLISPLDQWW